MTEAARATPPWTPAETRSGDYALKGAVFSPAGTPAAQVLIVQGRNEMPLKYAELYGRLTALGVRVTVYDHRGQGFNRRLTADPEKCHIDSFETYARDLMRMEESLDPGIPCAVIAVSMGCLIWLKRARMGKIPAFITKAVFVAPFLGIRQNVPLWAVGAAARLRCLAARLLSGDREPYFYPGDRFRKKTVGVDANTRSAENNERYFALYDEYPEARLGGMTAPWLLAAVRCLREIWSEPCRLPLPSLFLLAEKDNMVSCAKARRFLSERLSPDGAAARTVVLGDSLHDILIEKDECRNEAFANIIEFITDKARDNL